MQAGLWNLPAALSMISDLMRLPRCERDGIATHLITYDIADLPCQLAFVKSKWENHTSHAATHFVITLKTPQVGKADFLSGVVTATVKVPASPKDFPSVCFYSD